MHNNEIYSQHINKAIIKLWPFKSNQQVFRVNKLILAVKMIIKTIIIEFINI